MFRKLSTGLLMTAAIVLCTSATQARVAAGGDEARQPQPQTMLRRALQHDGIEREYFVYIPEGAILGEADLPTVVALHGYTSTATGFQAAHGLNRHADQHGYIVVYPQGSHFAVDDGEGQAFRITSWNDLAANMPQTDAGPHCTADSGNYPCPPECGSCTRCAWTSCYDDVGFVMAILDSIQSEFPVDGQRLYLLGVSNGGMMALRVGCSASERFAAVAPIIGQLAPGYACGPTQDLPMLHLFGGQDETVRYDGAAGRDDGFIYTSAALTASMWAAEMSCEDGPHTWENKISNEAGLVCTAYSGCSDDSHEVVSCMDPEGKHSWPAQGYANSPATCVTPEQYESLPDQGRCVPATAAYEHLGMDLIWEFMSQYRRPD